MSIAIVTCAEPGPLEGQAKLLFDSIRTFGGHLANVSLYCYSPRGKALPADTLRAFRTLNVTYVDEVLNTDFDHYPTANKIFACAHAEEALPDDVLVWADTDSVFVSEPNELSLPQDVPARVAPIWGKVIASEGAADPAESYWQEAYRICNVARQPRFVEAVVARVRVRLYLNAGLVAARRDRGFFAQWKQDFLRLVAMNHVPGDLNLADPTVWREYMSPARFMDQVALSMTAAKLEPELSLFGPLYNYPITYRHRLGSPLRDLELCQLKHVHYNASFNDKGFLERLDPPLERESEASQWLRHRLPLEPVREVG